MGDPVATCFLIHVQIHSMCGNSFHSYVDLPTALSFQGNRNLIELYKTYILKARQTDRQRERLQYAVKCWGCAGSCYECNNR